MGTKSKEIYMYLLGAVVVLGCFGITSLLIFHEVPEGSRDALNICLGILIGLGASVVNYFFGSSKGSADKTQLLNGKEMKP